MVADPRATHHDHIQRTVGDATGPARSAIAASWRRSILVHGLAPEDGGRARTVTAERLREAQEAMGPLTLAAQSVLDRLFQAVGDTGCCVLLTDANGIAVDRRGSPSDDDTFHHWGLWPGADWSEAAEGTNGIGTALVERRAVTIHRDEHFHSRNIGLSCTTHLIHDHLGRVAAALDVSSARADATAGMLGLITHAVSDAARAIETQVFREAFPDARILLAGDGADRSAALLAVDQDDLVIGATRAARTALKITDARIAAQLPASDILAAAVASSPSRAALMEAERGAVRRALARSDGNISGAARALGVSRATLHRKLNRLGLASH